MPRSLVRGLAPLGVVVLAFSCGNGDAPKNDGVAGAAGSGAVAGTVGASGRAGEAAAGAGDAMGGAATDAGQAGAAGSMDPDSAAGAGGGAVAGGAAGEGGASGAGGAAEPSCDDGKASTVDFVSATHGCGHLIDSDPNDGQSWIVFDAGFSVDPKSKYGWYINAEGEDGGNLIGNQTKCAALGFPGLDDWRVPTIDDVRTLAVGCATTASGGTCPLHDPSCLSQQCAYGGTPECESCQGGLAHDYINVDSVFETRPFFHTSSICSDCTGGEKDWVYLKGNGNFFAYGTAFGSPTVCVITNVADALPR